MKESISENVNVSLFLKFLAETAKDEQTVNGIMVVIRLISALKQLP